MPDLTSLLERTTPEDLPLLDRCDLTELARQARRRTRQQRATVAVAGLAVVAVLAGVVVSAMRAPRQPDDPRSTWAGPGGAPLDEPAGAWAQAEDPPFSARQSPFADALSDGRVLVWGGIDSDGLAVDGGIYDPSTGEWEAIPSAPLEPSSGLAVGNVERQVQLSDDRLMVVGGSVHLGAERARAAVYDVARRAWLPSPVVDLGSAPISSAPAAWDGQTLVLLPQTIGLEVYGPPATWRWRLGDQSWQRGAPAPIAPRTGAGSAFDGRRVALWSGSTNGRLQPDGAIYDVATDTWEPIPAAPVSGAEHPLVAWLDGQVVVSPSGVSPPVPDEQSRDIGTLAAYDPVGRTWKTTPRSPDFRASPGAPYLTSDGTAHVPPSRRTTQGTGVAEHVVYAGADSAGGAAQPWYLESGRWEQAPYPGLFRLGGFTLAVDGLDTTLSCCPEPAGLRAQVRIGPDRWLDAADPPFSPRRYETVVATGDKLVVIGGSVPDDEPGRRDVAVDDTWVFDLAG